MDCPTLRNSQVIEVATNDMARIFKEIVLWGEALWWPKQCMMKFIRLDEIPVQRGTRYMQKIQFPCAPSWTSVVTDIENNKSITRKFLDSFLDGYEQISITPKQDAVAVTYCLQYALRGRLYPVLWKLGLQGLHNRNITLILNSLKKHIEQ